MVGRYSPYIILRKPSIQGTLSTMQNQLIVALLVLLNQLKWSVTLDHELWHALWHTSQLRFSKVCEFLFTKKKKKKGEWILICSKIKSFLVIHNIVHTIIGVQYSWYVQLLTVGKCWSCWWNRFHAPSSGKAIVICIWNPGYRYLDLDHKRQT